MRGSQISHQEKSFLFLPENSNIIIRGSLVGVGGAGIIEQFPEKGSKFFLAEIHCWLKTNRRKLIIVAEERRGEECRAEEVIISNYSVSISSVSSPPV